MSKSFLIIACIIFATSSCISTAKNTKRVYNGDVNLYAEDLELPVSLRPDSLNNLPATEDGGFILAKGFYESEFKTYCLQPGTPDPSPRDAYLQSPVTGYRSGMIESVLSNSGSKADIKQKNVQLLLWSIVSNSNYNTLPKEVQYDANRLLTSKQIFELKGGWMTVARTISNNIHTGNDGIKRLFEIGTQSYDKYEKLAVLNEPSQINRPDFKIDQWHRQQEGYYVRYFPISYKSVKMQVYVPENLLDSSGKISGEYLVFNPTGMQVTPANSNAQRLGIGGTVINIIRKVVIINKDNRPAPKRVPEKKKKAKPPCIKKEK